MVTRLKYKDDVSNSFKDSKLTIFKLEQNGDAPGKKTEAAVEIRTEVRLLERGIFIATTSKEIQYHHLWVLQWNYTSV